MADQPPVAPVEGARQAAVWAAHVLAAGAAEEHGGVAAAVAQQDDLVAVGEGLADLLPQALGEVDLAGPARDPLLAQVDEDPLGERALAGALRERQQLQLPPLGVVAALEAGRGRDQEGGGAGVPAADEGEVAGVVARRELLLVGGVLLLVHHDQAEVGDRREEGRAGAEHHARLAARAPVPTPGGARRRPSRSAGWRGGRRSGARRRGRAPARGRSRAPAGSSSGRGRAPPRRRAGRPRSCRSRSSPGGGRARTRGRRRTAVSRFRACCWSSRRRISGRLRRHAHHVAVEGEALDLGELAEHAERDQPADHGGRALDRPRSPRPWWRGGPWRRGT